MHALFTLFLVVVATTLLTVGMVCWVAVRLARRVARAVTCRACAWRPRVPAAACRLHPVGEVAAVRRELAGDLKATRRAVSAGLAGGSPLEELARLTAGLSRRAQELDRELALAAAEPDRPARTRLLADLQPPLAEVHDACSQVRGAVNDTRVLRSAAGSGPATLTAQVRDEVQRLASWTGAYRELHEGT